MSLFTAKKPRKSVSINAIEPNGIPHSMSAGNEKPFSKFKNHQPPAVSVVTFSADVAQLYRTEHNPDPESLTNDLEEISQEFDESSGFAIVINGHSLVHCLTPELEIK